MRKITLAVAGKLMECLNESPAGLPRVVVTYEVESLSCCSYTSQVRALQLIVQSPCKSAAMMVQAVHAGTHSDQVVAFAELT